MLYITLYNAIIDEKAQDSRCENTKINVRQFKKMNVQFKISTKNRQKPERTFENYALILRKTLVLRNVSSDLDFTRAGKGRKG